MSQFLPKGLVLPRYEEINASLLISKYAEVKTELEKEESKKIAERSCKGKMRSRDVMRFSSLPKTEMVTLKLMGRLIIDQSGGVQENANLCLHPHFGFPQISGSAVKGTARHYVWEQWHEAVEEGKTELAKEKACDLIEIFGFPTGDKNLDNWSVKHLENTIDRAGKIAFFSAIPYGSSALEVEVLTCHHMDYYSPTKDKTRATDDENPNPQFFPVVKAGATFEFVVAPTTRGTEALAKKALFYLKSALEINGIGAKTAAGYGWFEEDISASTSLLEEKKKSLAQKEMGTLSPLDLAKRKLLEVVGTGFGEEALRILSEGTDEEQHALIQLFQKERKEDWKSWKKRAKKKPKLQERVVQTITLAKTLGEELI